MELASSAKDERPGVDFRKISPKENERIRIDSVRRVIRDKESPEKVALAYGYNRTNIYRWIAMYRKKGYKGLEYKKPVGRDKELSASEIRRLRSYLAKDPRQLKFHFGLWTVQMVRKLVKDKLGKEYALSGMHSLLKSLGYTYQKPLLRATQQDTAAVSRWKEEEYPKIKAEARREKRNIYFSDESGFQSIHNKSKTWGVKGVRLVVVHTGRRFSKGVISALTPQGKFRFMQYDGGMDATLFMKFMDRLQVGEEKRITLIVDGLPVHKSRAVKEYVEKTEGRVKIYYLPGYSPELNPDELVWSAAKGYVSRGLVGTKQELESHISTFLHSIQKRKDFVQKLFRHPDVSYASGD